MSGRKKKLDVTGKMPALLPESKQKDTFIFTHLAPND